jgi:hypothetical protein
VVGAELTSIILKYMTLDFTKKDGGSSDNLITVQITKVHCAKNPSVSRG